VLAGLGMVIAGSSAPASMGEHLISHYIDLMARPHPGSLHGEQVGVAALTISRMQNALLSAERPPEMRATRVDETAIRARYGAALADQVLGQFRAKALDDAGAARLNARLAAVWPAMRARLREVMLPTARLRGALEDAGAPTTGVDLGLPARFYRAAVRHAREIRDRYSILDLAGDAGVLEAFVVEES
jgi:glycerol-1-phosphate dehydrogenase [NAD(P)+]